MSFKYDQENSRIIHIKDEGQTAGRIVRQVELTAECIEEVAEAVVKKMARPEPQWEDMLVICDNCGHAIHVKGEIRKPERKRGEWEIDHLCSTSGGTYQVLRCSICEHSEPWLMGRNFCPNCGARMRGVEDD